MPPFIGMAMGAASAIAGAVGGGSDGEGEALPSPAGPSAESTSTQKIKNVAKNQPKLVIKGDTNKNNKSSGGGGRGRGKNKAKGGADVLSPELPTTLLLGVLLFTFLLIVTALLLRKG